MKNPLLSFVSATLLLLGCQTVPAGQSKGLPEFSGVALCENGIAAISVNHATARINECTVGSSQKFELTIRPEKTVDTQGEPINNSAWYGFRVDPIVESDIEVRLNYENGKHRYNPKLSYDGKNWTRLADDQVSKIGDAKVDLNLAHDGRPFYISAQEIFTKSAHDAWSEKMASHDFVAMTAIGKSRDGYPIQMLEAKTEPSKEKPYVVWVGRQHPPEVTGALALIPFTETVLGDSELAKRFLDHFNVLVVPMMNPDGVTDGHWRFNKGGMDLNRDWGPFTQPETQAVRDAFDRFENGGDEIAFFLDFHSTWRNLLYTQTDDEPTSPPMFARDWLANVEKNLDNNIYEFTREPRANSGRPISKNYMYDRFGISSITFEVGDSTNREAIDISAKVFAEEMMKLLLKHETGS